MKTLTLINSETNRFYTMEQLNNTTFKSTWGQIGDAETISTDHDLSIWDEIIVTKKGMGFVEKSNDPAFVTAFAAFKRSKVNEGRTMPGPEDDFGKDNIGDLNIANRLIALQQKIIDAESRRTQA